MRFPDLQSGKIANARQVLLFYYSQVRIGPIRKYGGSHIVRRTGGCPRYQVLVSKCRGDQDLCPIASYPSSPTAGYENAACLMRLHNNAR